MRPVLAALLGGIAAHAAQAADLPGPVLVPGVLAAQDVCANPRVTGRIVERFAWAEHNTWHRGFVMQEVLNARASGHPYAQPGIIERRYCTADALLSNGASATLFYAIEFGQGFASMGNYVDFCVLGLDPWHVHDEACRTVR